MSTDRDWHEWGEKDPYFGVVTHEEYRRRNLTDDARQRFFATGDEHVKHVLRVLERRFGELPRFHTAVDYGCGTGRLTCPIARVAERAIGLDVSAGMLEEARANTARFGLQNIEYRQVVDDAVSVLTEPCDFVHSFIVFQHIPRQRGEIIASRLLSRLKVGGYGALHFTVGSTRSSLHDAVSHVRNSNVLVHKMLNVLQGKSISEPRMRMEKYSLLALLEIFHAHGVDEFFCERTDHGGHIGVMFYLQKTR